MQHLEDRQRDLKVFGFDNPSVPEVNGFFGEVKNFGVMGGNDQGASLVPAHVEDQLH